MFRKTCHGKKILIVEADCVDRETLSMVLAAEGYMVPAPANHAETVDILRSAERPDLVLLDLSKQKKDVLELCRALQQDPALSSIPIIVLAQKDLRDQAMAFGCIAFLEKPVDTHRLLEKINSHFFSSSLSETSKCEA